MRIDACFDSHVHWAATGEFTHRLHLESLTSPQAVAKLKVEHFHRREQWLLGFGWDETEWSEKPTRHHLDKVFPNEPVAFSRIDGHALWVNSEALKRAGLLNDGATGILVDRATDPIHKLIPATTSLEMRRYLLQAVKTFNECGITHIRDLTCDETQWNEARKLDDSGLLTLAVEEFFWLKGIDDLAKVMAVTLAARASQSRSLRVKGLKIFVDGALGSEGAWLSRCYHGSENRGQRLWEAEAVREVLIKCWEQKLEVACHVIGDAAADWIVNLALQLKNEGKKGILHLEHLELVLPETVDKMQELTVECHLQPTHWLGDQRWLANKVGDLSRHAFPWRRLQESEIAFDFGSDSPISSPDLSRLFMALRHSADAGIPRLLGLPNTYMGHRDLSWAPNSFTLFEEEAPTQVVFRGEHLV